MLPVENPVDVPPLLSARPKAQRGAIAVTETLRDCNARVRLAAGSAIDEVALAAEYLAVFLPNRTSIAPPLSLHDLGQSMNMCLQLSRSVARAAVIGDQADWQPAGTNCH